MQVPKRRPGKFTNEEPDRFITEEKARSLEATMKRIIDVDLPQASKDVAVAKELGDFTENASYAEAKSRLRRFSDRVTSIRNRLAFATIIQKGPAPDGSVKIGSTVKVRFNGKEKTFEILGSQETDPSAGRISHLSPLGHLLIGKNPGESATLNREGREIVYEIISVS